MTNNEFINYLYALGMLKNVDGNYIDTIRNYKYYLGDIFLDFKNIGISESTIAILMDNGIERLNDNLIDLLNILVEVFKDYVYYINKDIKKYANTVARELIVDDSWKIYSKYARVVINPKIIYIDAKRYRITASGETINDDQTWHFSMYDDYGNAFDNVDMIVCKDRKWDKIVLKDKSNQISKLNKLLKCEDKYELIVLPYYSNTKVSDLVTNRLDLLLD